LLALIALPANSRGRRPALSHGQAKALWRLREGIPEATAKRGPQYKYDLSIPTAVMYKLVEVQTARCAKRAAFLPLIRACAGREGTRG
jgi:hypothetical protein